MYNDSMRKVNEEKLLVFLAHNHPVHFRESLQRIIIELIVSRNLFGKTPLGFILLIALEALPKKSLECV